jgi:surfeit locus 1 family protein
VSGLLRLPPERKPSWFLPDNKPDRNFWFWVDLPAMARWAGVDGPVAPYFVDAGPQANPGGLPIGGQTHIELPNDHLQYAITWFALAIGLTTVYLVFHHQRGRLVIRRKP